MINIFSKLYFLRYFVIVLLVCNILSAGVLIHAQNEGFTITPSTKRATLGKHVEIFEDPSGVLNLEDILSNDIQAQFVQSNQEEPGFGFTSSAYWVKLRIINNLDQEFSWYLELGYPLIDYIDLYQHDKYGKYSVIKTGDKLSFDTRMYDHRNFIFDLTQQANSTITYYIHLKSGSSMNFPLYLWTEKELVEEITLNQLLLGIFFGAIVIMVIYNFFLFIGFRDWSYLYLLFFILFWGLAQSAIDGLAYQYLWKNWNWWANINIPFFIYATLIASTHFCRSLLDTRKSIPLFDKILRIELLIYFTGLVLSLFIQYAFMIKTATALAILTVLSVGTAGIIMLKKRNHAALFFIIAWGTFLFGVVLFALKTFGVLESNILTRWSIQIGFFALITLFSLAVQDRINTEKKEKLKVQKKLVTTLKQSERKLEEKVQKRTQELFAKNTLLDSRAKKLANINRLAEKVNSTLNIQEIMQIICTEMVSLFPVRNAGIGLLDDTKTNLKIVAFHTLDPDERNATGMELSISDYRAFQIISDTKQPLVIEDAQNDPRTKSIHSVMHERGTKGLLILPVLSMNKVIGTIGMPSKDPEYSFSDEEIEFAKTIANQVASAIENARLYSQTEKARDVAEDDLEIGRQIQTGFIPETLPELKDWEIAAHFKPARQVAGDFYDVFKLEDKRLTAIVIADICDKGVGAALFMVLFRSLIRAFCKVVITDIEAQLMEIMLNINNYIAENHGRSNMFASLFIGILNEENANLYYINGGIDPPVVIDKKGEIKNTLLPTGPVVGMLLDMTFTIKTILIEKGDILFCYTDGNTDLKNEDEKAYTEEALLNSLKYTWSSALSMLFKINSDLAKHMGKQDQYDDITQITLRRKLSQTDHVHKAEGIAVLENLEGLRDFVENAAISSGLHNENIHAFKLAAEEIFTNIIFHGYKDMIPGLIKILFLVEKDKASLKISDFGKFFSPDESEPPEIEANWQDRNIGGLGLFLVKELFDTIKYQKADDNSNQLILEKIINI